jgi:hypothetical protein
VAYRLQARETVVTGIEQLQGRKRILRVGRSKAIAAYWRLGKRDT